MTDVVNLRTFRRRKAREAARRAGDEAAAAHGRSKAEKAAARLETSLAERRLDGHRRDPDRPDDDG